MSESPHATLTEHDAVLTVTFERPDKLNAIDAEMTAVLWDAVRTLADRDDLCVLVIRAIGDYFSAGIDIGEIVISERTLSRYRRDYRDHTRLYDEFEAVDKPIILAAQGHCFGAGVEMAASCDFRFASSAATFQLPEIDLAVIPGSGGTSRLTKLVGPHWTKWLAMAGERIDAERALLIGFVHDVFGPDEFDERVDRFARRLAGLPREALGIAKVAVDMCTNADPTSARYVEQLANAALAAGEEHKRLVAEFIQRSQRRAEP
jgi:enoyl-CoA hydratase